jgi:hypothetical protein
MFIYNLRRREGREGEGCKIKINEMKIAVE